MRPKCFRKSFYLLNYYVYSSCEGVFFSFSFGFYHYIDTIGTVTVCGSHGCVWVFLHVSVLTPLPLTEVRVLSNTSYFTSTELLHAVYTLFGYTTLSWQCALNFDPLGGISVLEYKYVVLGMECAFLCHWAVGCLCSLSFVYICVTHRDVCDDPPLCSGL